MSTRQDENDTLSSMNRVQVIGYGSLLSKESALRSAPSVSRFRLVRVSGYMRLFNKVSGRWIAAPSTSSEPLIASCAIRASSGFEITCSAFRVSEADFQTIFEREHHYRWVEAECIETDGSKSVGRMCNEWNDSDYRLNRCVTDAEYRGRLGAYYPGRIWRDDILPYPPYLEECLAAAHGHDEEVHGNFCTTSFLADGVTPLEEYLASGSRGGSRSSLNRENAPQI